MKNSMLANMANFLLPLSEILHGFHFILLF